MGFDSLRQESWYLHLGNPKVFLYGRQLAIPGDDKKS